MDFLKTHQPASSLKQESLEKVVIFSKKKKKFRNASFVLSNSGFCLLPAKKNCHGRSANMAA